MRTLLTLPLALAWTAGIGVPSALSGVFDRSGHASYLFGRAWGRTCLRIWGMRVRVQGAEHVPAGPAVFAANHGSALDIPILFGHLPADFRILHKRSLYLVPVIGQYLYLGGHVGVDRGRPRAARRSLARAAERIRGGTSLAVFPEGTRSRDAGVSAFKRGSFVIAIEAGVPVVPVSLAGVKELAPHGLLLSHPGTITMTLHPPHPTAGLRVDDAQELAERVRRSVLGALAPPAAS